MIYTLYKMELKYEIWLIISFLNIVQASVDGISCFKCTGILRPGRHERELCSRFDGSAQFQVFCPSSTFCMKRTVHYKLQNGTLITAVAERDCAPQTRFSRVYDYGDGEWYDREDIIETAYEEGCFTGEDRQGDGRPPEYCFCSFHLCNASAPSKIGNVLNVFLMIMTVLTSFIGTDHLSAQVFNVS